MNLALRRATGTDVAYLAGLLGTADVAPFLAAVRATTAAEIAREVERSETEPEAFGVMVVEVDSEPAGTVTWERVNVRSRIASVSGFAIDPRLRGQGVGVAGSTACCSGSWRRTSSSHRSRGSRPTRPRSCSL